MSLFFLLQSVLSSPASPCNTVINIIFICFCVGDIIETHTIMHEMDTGKSLSHSHQESSSKIKNRQKEIFP